jgi:hypothetical protein
MIVPIRNIISIITLFQKNKLGFIFIFTFLIFTGSLLPNKNLYAQDIISDKIISLNKTFCECPSLSSLGNFSIK